MKIKILVSCLVITVAAVAALPVRYKQWVYDFTMTCGGTFKLSETTTKVAISGKATELKNGFLQFIVDKSTGPGAPAVGFQQFGIRVPGLSLISGPFLKTDIRLTLAPETGTCPTSDWTGIFTYAKWFGTAGTDTDVSQRGLAAFGVSTWKPADNQMLDWEARNLVDYTRPPSFSPITLDGTCANGVITFTGSGDRGGKMWISPQGNSVYLTDTERAMFMHQQGSVPPLSDLNGDYAAMVWYGYGEGAFYISLGMSGGVIEGNELKDVANGEESPDRHWKISNFQPDTPFAGVMTADWEFTGYKPTHAACVVRTMEKRHIFCTGQAPWDTKSPVNMALISQN